jgi:NAD(P)-dependent dehydrogenase (short-subunit alcohol dehydrogenase family)
MNLLTDKVAIVTGASSGIGRAAAKLFAAEGAKVVAGARRQAELDSLVAEIREAGGEAVAVAGDVRDKAFHAALVETATAEFGGLDVAFNNAGTLGPSTLTVDTSDEDWQETLDTNLTAHFYAAKAQIPALQARGGGSLIFTSSFVGWTVTFPTKAAYGASKAGLIGLVKAIAVEHGAERIRANALLPGGTNTEMATSFAPTEEALNAVRAMMAVERIAEPEEMAQSALYLASDMSTFTTGSAMLVDGGLSVKKG